MIRGIRIGVDPHATHGRDAFASNEEEIPAVGTLRPLVVIMNAARGIIWDVRVNELPSIVEGSGLSG